MTSKSPNIFDFALVMMLGLLGLRIEIYAADIADVGEEHGHRVIKVHGKGSKIVLVPVPPGLGRALDRATADRMGGSILLTASLIQPIGSGEGDMRFLAWQGTP